MVKIMETLLKLMIWGYPYFWKHPFAFICYLGTLNPSGVSVVGLRPNLLVLLVLHIIPVGGGGTAVDQGDHPIEALFLGRNIVLHAQRQKEQLEINELM